MADRNWEAHRGFRMVSIKPVLLKGLIDEKAGKININW
jgi:hypothetical protein